MKDAAGFPFGKADRLYLYLHVQKLCVEWGSISQGGPANTKGLTASQGGPEFSGSDDLPKAGNRHPRPQDNSLQEPLKRLKMDSYTVSESVGSSSLTCFDPASLGGQVYARIPGKELTQIA